MRAKPKFLLAALIVTFCLAPACSSRRQRQAPVVLAPSRPANWRDRDSAVVFEKFMLPSTPPEAVVVVYGSAGGVDGVLERDTITYSVPASGVLRVRRKMPVPWAETHLYLTTTTSSTEIPVAADCALHRLATRRFPGRLFGCWMPVVVSGTPPDPYMAVALSDSVGLARAFNHAMRLINSELFSNRLHDLPQWIEPSHDTQRNPIPEVQKSVNQVGDVTAGPQ